MADEVVNVLRHEGVIFYFNVAVTDIKDLGAEKEVTVTDSEGKTTFLKAELILVAMGRRANLEGLVSERSLL